MPTYIALKLVEDVLTHENGSVTLPQIQESEAIITFTNGGGCFDSKSASSQKRSLTEIVDLII